MSISLCNIFFQKGMRRLKVSFGKDSLNCIGRVIILTSFNVRIFRGNIFITLDLLVGVLNLFTIKCTQYNKF